MSARSPVSCRSSKGPRWAAPRAHGARLDGPGFAPIMFTWTPRSSQPEASDPAPLPPGLPRPGSRLRPFACPQPRPRSTSEHGCGSAGPGGRGLLWRAPAVLRGCRCPRRSPPETQLLPRRLRPQADLQGTRRAGGRTALSHGRGAGKESWGDPSVGRRGAQARGSHKGSGRRPRLLGRGERAGGGGLEVGIRLQSVPRLLRGGGGRARTGVLRTEPSPWSQDFVYRRGEAPEPSRRGWRGNGALLGRGRRGIGAAKGCGGL